MTNIPFTLIPPTVILNFEEKKELHAIEEKYKTILDAPDSKAKGEDFYQFVFSLKLKKTTNVGLHYFCLQHNVALKDLAANQNISTDIALFLFIKLEPGIGFTMFASTICKEILEKFEPHVVPAMLASTVYRELLLNPVIYDNLNLFEKLIDKTIEDNPSLLAIIVGRMDSAPINILMFLIPRIGSSQLTRASAFSLFYTDVIYARSNEIFAWVGLNNPKLKDLPLSWVMRAYGFTNGVFDD